MSVAHDDFLGEEVEALLETIFRLYNHDFRGYAPASLKRRIARAMQIFNLKNVYELHTHILLGRPRFEELLRQLIVPVSTMFRDAAYFIALRNKVIPLLKAYGHLRVWVAGCSTGEEVFSLAILLREHGLLDRTIIYATDINTDALDQAQRGVFPLKNLPQYIENYYKAGGRNEFSKYYHADYDRFVIDRALRKKIIFSNHSLATDSAFAEMNFISCRNTLMYFGSALKNDVLRMFHESLFSNGFLGIGSKESVRFTALSEKFDTLSPDAKLFIKNNTDTSISRTNRVIY